MKLTYRPEIDGLRAIAVGAVILYHAQITILGHQPFKGGFIGVDIFFVISGYLITSLILKELVKTGSYSFKYFYERRIRRILPALLFVILVSLPFAWMYLLPSSFVDFSKSIFYSLGFSSNFYFHYSGQIYGAESGLLKPFLHTWSLSVEEQFYILFPIVLLVTFKYFRKYLIHILILGFIISLGLAEWGSRNHPSFNFYVLPTRGWELLAGSILAYFETTNGNRSKNKTLNLILPTIGLLLIGHSILFFNDEIFHPSFYTLSPIIGVCLIIWFSNKDELISKILSTKLFVGFGLISYSLYLWHYPIFAFARTRYLMTSPTEKIIFILLSIFLSILTFYFVERPFRKKNFQFKKIIIFLISIVFIIVSFLSYKVSSYKEFGNINLNYENKPTYGKFYNFNSDTNLVIIGDSLMEEMSNELYKIQKYNILSLVKPGCIMLPNMNKIHILEDKIYDGCNEQFNYERKELLDQILINKKKTYIIYGGNFSNYLNNYTYKQFIDKQFEKKFRFKFEKSKSFNDEYTIKDSINELFQVIDKNNLILIYPYVEFEFHTKRKLSVNKEFINKTKFSDFYTFSSKHFELFDLINVPKMNRIYPHKFICKYEEYKFCYANIDNYIFVEDTNHPTNYFIKLIINKIDNYILNSD